MRECSDERAFRSLRSTNEVTAGGRTSVQLPPRRLAHWCNLDHGRTTTDCSKQHERHPSLLAEDAEMLNAVCIGTSCPGIVRAVMHSRGRRTCVQLECKRAWAGTERQSKPPFLTTAHRTVQLAQDGGRMLILVDEVPLVQLKAGTKDRRLFHAIFNACAVVVPLLCSSVLGCVEAHLLVNQGNFHLANSDQALLHLYRDDQGCTARWVATRELRSLRSMCASLGCIRGRFGYMQRHCTGIGISPGSVWILPGVRPREERPSRCFFPACVPGW